MASMLNLLHFYNISPPSDEAKQKRNCTLLVVFQKNKQTKNCFIDAKVASLPTRLRKCAQQGMKKALGFMSKIIFCTLECFPFIFTSFSYWPLRWLSGIFRTSSCFKTTLVKASLLVSSTERKPKNYSLISALSQVWQFTKQITTIICSIWPRLDVQSTIIE